MEADTRLSLFLSSLWGWGQQSPLWPHRVLGNAGKGVDPRPPTLPCTNQVHRQSEPSPQRPGWDREETHKYKTAYACKWTQCIRIGAFVQGTSLICLPIHFTDEDTEAHRG